MKKTIVFTKRIAAALFLLTLILALCSCSDTADTSNPPGTEPTDTVSVASPSNEPVSIANSPSTEPSNTVGEVSPSNTPVDDDNNSVYPITIRTQVNWNDVVTETIGGPPKKVLVGGSEMVDFLVYFGLEDIIYTTVYTVEPWSRGSKLSGDMKELAESLPVVSDYYTVTMEEMYVLMDEGIDMVLSGLVTVGYPEDMDADEFVKLGIPFVYPYNLTFDGSYKIGGSHLCSSGDVFDAYRDLGILLGIQNEVEEYIRGQRTEMRAILDKINESEYPKGREVYYVIHNGVDTFIDNYMDNTVQEYVELCGCKYIGEPGIGLQRPGYETIIDLDPEIIIVRCTNSSLVPFDQLEPFQVLQALQDGKLYITSTLPSTSNTSGLDLAGQLREVASYLYPDVDFSK